jgi:hypothetical protein
MKTPDADYVAKAIYNLDFDNILGLWSYGLDRELTDVEKEREKEQKLTSDNLALFEQTKERYKRLPSVKKNECDILTDLRSTLFSQWYLIVTARNKAASRQRAH